MSLSNLSKKYGQGSELIYKVLRGSRQFYCHRVGYKLIKSNK